jgi:hypothetical protein
VARVVAYVPDLLFGSSVQAALTAAGHDVELVGRLEPGLLADVLVVDLCADAPERIEQVGANRPAGAPVLAFYSHVETDVKALAEQAGFEVVVPRSRMAREGPALVDRLSA